MQPTATVHLRAKTAPGSRAVSYYYAEFYNPQRHPTRKRISLKTADQSAARMSIGDMEREFYAGLFDPWTQAPRRDGVPVGDAVRLFLKSRAGLRPKTIDGYENILELFQKSLPLGLPFAGIEPRHVGAFLKGRALGEQSRRTYTRHLRVFFRWAAAEGLWHGPLPTESKVRKARVTSGLPKFLSEEEYARLLRAIEADGVLCADTPTASAVSQAIRFAVGTGFRLGEVCALRWSAVGLDTGFVTVANTADFQTKSGRERSVYLAGDARRVIEERRNARTTEADAHVFLRPSGVPLGKEYLSKRFAYYREKAGLPPSIHFHSLRHTFAAWFVLRGGDIYRLRAILGHADVTTTAVYAHLRPDAIREDMERLFGDEAESRSAAMARLQEKCARLERQVRRLKVRLRAYREVEGYKRVQG